MRRIKRTLSAILLAVTLFIFTYKPSDHEYLSESPTESQYEIKALEYNGFNTMYKQYTDKQRQQAESERKAKRQQALEEAHRLYDMQQAQKAKIAEEKRRIALDRQQAEAKRQAERQRLAAQKQAKQQQISRSDDANLTQLTMLATHYGPDCAGCSGITTSEYDVRNTIYYNGMRVLAAPRSIPLYTIMRVTYPNGTSFKGIVLDRGGDIVDGRLDILVASENEAYQLGKQTVTVTILKDGKGR
ncbi:hypothetical protein 8F11_42 [uncultured Caudovirales phage]|uniref:3D domain containing protein n=1 Tax=uncultured Caudovirales phage TaxID=2100421 RepID=A0A2H4J475_9CAUD|nr:hypothetical protein 8F11_42 [uncultured Caudovirales phage]